MDYKVTTSFLNDEKTFCYGGQDFGTQLLSEVLIVANN